MNDDVLDGYAFKHEFPTPFDWNVRECVTLHELRMRGFAAMIMEKPRWWEKVFDDTLVAKWKEEMRELDAVAVAAQEKQDNDVYYHYVETEGSERPQRWARDSVTDAQLDWVFAFLKHAAGARDEVTGMQACFNNSVFPLRY